MPAQDVESFFPQLSIEGYSITSPETPDYNCHAWGVEVTDQWFQPAGLGGYYWPPNLPMNTRLSTFVELYRRYGYEPCADGNLQQGFEKLALYLDSTGEVTHTARQKSSGAWTSKLGVMEDIDHQTVTALEGPHYGTVGQFLRRPKV